MKLVLKCHLVVHILDDYLQANKKKKDKKQISEN